MSELKQIAFIGAGRMASAIIRGISSKGYPKESIRVCSKSGNSAKSIAADIGINFEDSVIHATRDSSVTVLCCKPHQLEQISSQVELNGQLIISVLAGIKIKKLRAAFPKAASIVRIMPNTPAQIAKGISGITTESKLSHSFSITVEFILSALGDHVAVAEDKLDALTGLSGSGPAYVFEFIAGLRDGGIKAGLSPDDSIKLAIQTVLGAAELVKSSSLSPEELRDQVTSPGGTTLAGLEVLNGSDFRGLLSKTIEAAAKRSTELSQD